MNSKKRSLPPQVSARLPRYYRVLRTMIGEDRLRTSSGELARRMQLTPSQVRQDFSNLGGVGTQGYGYNVKDLYSAVGARIGIPMNYGAVIVCRDIRFALLLAADECFTSRGVRLRAAFTDGGDLTGAELRRGAVPSAVPEGEGLAYERAARYCESQRAEGDPVSVALLGCERREAEAAADALVRAGVRGIWNYTGELISPKGAAVINFNFTDALLSLCCEITAAGENGAGTANGQSPASTATAEERETWESAVAAENRDSGDTRAMPEKENAPETVGAGEEASERRRGSDE